MSASSSPTRSFKEVARATAMLAGGDDGSGGGRRAGHMVQGSRGGVGWGGWSGVGWGGAGGAGRVLPSFALSPGCNTAGGHRTKRSWEEEALHPVPPTPTPPPADPVPSPGLHPARNDTHASRTSRPPPTPTCGGRLAHSALCRRNCHNMIHRLQAQPLGRLLLLVCPRRRRRNRAGRPCAYACPARRCSGRSCKPRRAAGGHAAAFRAALPAARCGRRVRPKDQQQLQETSACGRAYKPDGRNACRGLVAQEAAAMISGRRGARLLP